MKKQSLVVSIIIIFFAFVLAIPIFNQYSVSQIDYYTYLFGKDVDWGVVTVEQSKTLMDPYEIRSIMDEKAVANNIVIFQLKFEPDESGNYITTLNVTSNETQLADRIFLGKGKLAKVDKVYSTNSKDKTTRIAIIMFDGLYEIKPFTDQIDTGGWFYCRSLAGDVNENLDNWVKDVSDEIPGFTYHLQPNEAASIKFNEIPFNLFGNKLVKVAVSIILVLYLCLYTFQLYKQISIYKLEGHSNFHIYWLIFQRYFILLTMCSIALIVMGSLILYGGALNTLKLFLISVFSQWAQLLLMVEVLSLSVVIIIASIPTFSGSKGKNYLQEIQFIGYAAKYVVTLLLLPMVLPHLDTVENLIIMMTHHDRAFEMYENKFRFGSQVASNWVTDIGSDNIVNLYNDIANETEMFQFGTGYIGFSLETNRNPEEVYVANWEYLVNNQLIDASDDPKVYRIFMTENIRSEQQRYLDYYISKYGQYGGTYDNFEIIYIEPNFPIYDYYRLLFAEDFYTLPIIYIPVEDQFLGQVNGHTFTFDGDVAQAQQYINHKFIEYGYSPMFQIVSEQANLQMFYNKFFSKYIKGLMRFALVVLCYIFTTVFMFDCDRELNHKKYRIAFYEGQSAYRLPAYLLRFISPLLLGMISLIVLKKLSLDLSSIRVIFCMVIIELISFMFYLKKCYRKG